MKEGSLKIGTCPNQCELMLDIHFIIVSPSFWCSSIDMICNDVLAYMDLTVACLLFIHAAQYPPCYFRMKGNLSFIQLSTRTGIEHISDE